jgi:hypothetical protein
MAAAVTSINGERSGGREGREVRPFLAQEDEGVVAVSGAAADVDAHAGQLSMVERVRGGAAVERSSAAWLGEEEGARVGPACHREEGGSAGLGGLG